MTEREKLTTWQVETVLYSIARETCRDEGVPWEHADHWHYATMADYGDDLRQQWDDQRNGVCLGCGCAMPKHTAIPNAPRFYCTSCDLLCDGRTYTGSAPPVK